MRVLAVVICIAVGVISSSTANRFSLPNDETFSVMTINNRNDDATSDEVFVAGGNIIYKLSANLSQLMNVTVSNDATVSVRGLSVSNGGQYVVVVACLSTGSCIGYDVNNLTSTSSVSLSEGGQTPLNGDEPVVIFPGAVEGIVYTATATDFHQEYLMSLGRYSVSSRSIMANTTRDYALRRENPDFNARIFKGGFNVDNFTYYIVEDDGTDIRILRVCNESMNPTFQALYEIQLICGRSGQTAQSTVFAGASLYENFINSTNNILLLLVQPSPGQPGTTRLCTYTINDINTAMDAGLTDCAANGNSRATVWGRFPPSLVQAICATTTVSI